MNHHTIKCRFEFFTGLVSGEKTFEYRRNDRNYQVGDRLTIAEWEPTRGFTGCSLDYEITYVLSNSMLPDVPADFVVLALAPLWR